MKIDDGSLNQYLIKNLRSLTEADPSLLANYVAALLRNNKPKKELQKLCIDQLYDFLGDGTKSFVAKLFHALEDGTVPSSTEDVESSKPVESAPLVSSTDVNELRTSSPRLERLPGTVLRAFSDEGEGESSDDEDDDRNHKHKRRVTRSRSFDRDGDEEDSGVYSKRGRGTDCGHALRDVGRMADDRKGPGHFMNSERDSVAKPERRVGREHGFGRFGAEGGQRGNIKAGPQFRGEGPGTRFDGQNGMMRGGIGRGRGFGGSWLPHEQRFPPPSFSDSLEFAPSLLPPGPQVSGFFSGRGIPGRGVPHSPWPGYGPHPGTGTGPTEHAHTMSAGMQGGRAPHPLSAGIGLNINMARLRCLDFEERGYCLRGDLCPMEHGANRIVVEDVQSLSKFNLPVTIPSGRGMGVGPACGPSLGPVLAPGLSLVNRGSRVGREMSSTGTGDKALLNGCVLSSAETEPDFYDPDQPLWNHEGLEASGGLSKLPSYQKGSEDPDWDSDKGDKGKNRESGENVDAGRVGKGGNTNGSQGTESGPSVWDRIGPVDRIGSRLEGGPHLADSSLEGPHGGKVLRKEGADEIPARGKGGWRGKWIHDFQVCDGSAPREATSNSTLIRMRSSGRGETGSGQRYGEGTSYGARGTGCRGSSGFGAERAQRTLYVSLIPVHSNKTELLTAHFQKFGDILDLRIPSHSDRAFVQFSRREDAEAALTAPDAVMGNRFIRLSWANRDSIPDPGSTVMSPSNKTSGKARAGTAVNVPEYATLNRTAGISTASDTAPSAVGSKVVVSNGTSGLTPGCGAALMRQQELEKMKEAIRIKQESLAQKRVDFRRKLEAKLAKQGSMHADGSELEQSSKRRKLKNAEDSSGASVTQGTVVTTVSQSKPKPPTPQTTTEPSPTGLWKTRSVEVTGNVGANQPSLPPSRSGWLQNTRASSMNLSHPSVSWGPTRFKLDNRTSVFRVMPPFPSFVSEIAVLKDHFAVFGELSDVEVEGAEGEKADVSKLSEIQSVRVSFATRRSAERAYTQGKWLQGQCLQLVWVTPATHSSGAAGNSAIVLSSSNLEGPSSMDQGEANGTRYSDGETGKAIQEIQTTETEEDVRVGEASKYAGGKEKNFCTYPSNVESRREGASSAPQIVEESPGRPCALTESGGAPVGSCDL